jgi:hypothetical protein
MNAVGVSDRTPGKHGALDAFLGKQVGVMSTPAFHGRRLHLVDCTAGNGQPTAYSTTTSPDIITRHARWALERDIQVTVRMYERAPSNYMSLVERFKDWDVLCEPAESMKPFWHSTDLLFVVNDPNSVADWALPNALKYAPQLTTVFSTLGCNVGGLKRVPRSERDHWYQHVQQQIAMLQRWHDALLVILDNDASQWAYLVNAPSRWRDEIAKAFKKSFNGREISTAWWKMDQEVFNSMCDQLFLTKKELKS